MVVIRSMQGEAEKAWKELRLLDVRHDGKCMRAPGGGFIFATDQDTASRLIQEGKADFSGTPPMLTIK